MMKKHKNVKLTAWEESRVLRDASEMLGGFYRFNGVWDMEPCPEPVDNHDLRWDVKYRDDPEWAFMFVRMDYLYKLRLAAEISGDERYARHGIKIIGKWWRDNHKFINGLFGRASRKLFRNSLGYRTLDMAIMISNVADYTRWCQENGLIDKRQEKTCTKRIRRIIAHLNKQTNPDFKDFSNWGLLESGNMAYTMLRLGITNHYSEVRDRLVRQAHNQINANGSHVESSPMYLVQCLWILLRVLSLPECDCRRSLRPPVMAGCRYIAGIRGPDNCIPNLGDSDVTDISDLMIVAGKTLGTDEFDGFVSRVLDPEYAVKFNMERGQEILEGAKAGQKETQASRHPSLIEYPYQTVYRSGDAWLLCSNIPRAGYGHKHCDYLSLLYALNGKDVLVDLVGIDVER